MKPKQTVYSSNFFFLKEMLRFCNLYLFRTRMRVVNTELVTCLTPQSTCYTLIFFFEHKCAAAWKLPLYFINTSARVRSSLIYFRFAFCYSGNLCFFSRIRARHTQQTLCVATLTNTIDATERTKEIVKFECSNYYYFTRCLDASVECLCFSLFLSLLRKFNFCFLLSKMLMYDSTTKWDTRSASKMRATSATAVHTLFSVRSSNCHWDGNVTERRNR